MKRKYEIVWLQHCEVQYKNDSGKMEACGEPAAAIMVFDDGGESVFMCRKHLDIVKEDIDESED